MAEPFTPAPPSHAEQPDADASAEPRAREPLWRHLLGDSLRERRNDLGQTLDAVASRAGVSPQYLSEIERGLKEPSSEIIAAVGGALGTSLLDLTIDVAQSLAAASAPAARVSVSRGAFALAA